MLRPRPTCPPRGFTLVELLVVMAIIVLLLAATLPAMRGVMGSNGRKGAVRVLLGTFDEARARAATDGRATYVVFLCPNPKATPAPDLKPNPDKWGRAYAVFEESAATFAPEQISAWVSLPTGVAFKVDDGGGWSTSIMNRPLKPYPNPVPDPANPPDPTKLDPVFIVPTGTGSTPKAIVQPYVKFTPGGAIDYTGYADVTKPDASNNRPYLRVLLFEGSLDTNSGSELATKRLPGDSDKQKLALEEIQLQTATGRARYTVDPSEILVATAPTSP